MKTYKVTCVTEIDFASQERAYFRSLICVLNETSEVFGKCRLPKFVRRYLRNFGSLPYQRSNMSFLPGRLKPRKRLSSRRKPGPQKSRQISVIFWHSGALNCPGYTGQLFFQGLKGLRSRLTGSCRERPGCQNLTLTRFQL